MKKVIGIAAVLLVLFSLGWVYQMRAQSFDGIVNSLRSGNASALAATFESNVELTIKNTGNSYSRNQAEMILKNFFTTNAPKSFTISHQGTSPEGAKYIIGHLATASGNFRTYVYAKTVGGKLVTQEIRLEEQ